jgi:HEAT repeat protein
MNMLKSSFLLLVESLFLLAVVTSSFAGDSFPVQKRVGKFPSVEQMGGSDFPGFEVDLQKRKCMEECLFRNQRISMGFAAIEEICRKDCEFEEALRLVESDNKKEYTAGIETLCESSDRRAVEPLVKALQRDLRKRTGIWAMIIPALGNLQDKRAVPVLITTLTNMDEYWLGRAMSAESLGLIGDPVAIPSLLAAAWRADTRDAAIIALAKFQDKRVISVLISALNMEEEPETREAAMAGLRRMGSMAVPEMMQSFSDVSPEYPETYKRRCLCHLLGDSGDQRAMTLLSRSRNDPDDSIRKCAAGYVE